MESQTRHLSLTLVASQGPQGGPQPGEGQAWGQKSCEVGSPGAPELSALRPVLGDCPPRRSPQLASDTEGLFLPPGSSGK